MREAVPMVASIPFSAHCVHHSVCRRNDTAGMAAVHQVVCPFSHFIHHFLNGYARRGNQPQIPSRFLVPADIGIHFFHEPHHKNIQNKEERKCSKMRIAIEAQRIFRNDKHGMDFVILETLKELQKRKDGNEYYVFVAPGEDRCLEESENLHIIELRCLLIHCGSR